ncbi:Serine/threonine-protein kinase pkn5 [Planctomycetes bacterium CA13]|uniref:Serine/threonine-protein kinase pkn5 n=1 Tax=Novipirellula herctigrandis TaxID=2527986 RepID=A0A5C5Z317_9BACT|nr:Serine/threonine-protein kinase pkn5 [Planctomycetes bacterium CA13]
MAVALSEFWTRLVRSGFTDAAGCKHFAAKYAQASAGTPPADALSLAQYLVRSGELTEFQAKALLRTELKSLSIGPFLQTESVAPAPFSSWIRVQRRQKSIDKKRIGVLFRATAERLSGGRDQWLAAHAKVQAESLQSIELEQVQTGIIVFSELPSGQNLFEILANKPARSTQRVCRIGIAICDALAALHAVSLWHGAIRSDRVWITQSGQSLLLRDPSGPPTPPNAANRAAWLDTLASPLNYAAPEFATVATQCNAATDIYSLGGLLYELATGKPPHQAASDEERLSLHASEIPTLITEAVTKGESGDPLMRVLAYAMAKNPNARFESIQQFADALRVVESVTQTPATSKPATSKPATSKPATSKPATSKPATSKPVAKVVETDKQPVPPKNIPVVAPEPLPTPERRPEPTPVLEISAPPPRPPVVESPVTPSEREPVPREPVRRRKKKRTKAPLVLSFLGAAVLLLGITLLVRGPAEPTTTSSKNRPRPTVPDWVPPPTKRTVPREPETATLSTEVSGYTLVDDDRLLWAPPYRPGDAAPLSMLPPGPGILITVDLASLDSNSSSRELLDAFSPDLTNLLGKAAARAKVQVDEIERLTVALHKSTAAKLPVGWPEVSLAITLRQPKSLGSLIEAWDVSESRTPEGKTIYAGDAIDADAFYVPADVGTDITRFTLGTVARVREVAEMDGADIPLPRNMQSLWNATSQESLLAMLVTPNFLFSDAQGMLQDGAPRWLPSLKELLIPNVAAAMFTTSFDQGNLYAEVRLAPSGGISESSLKQSLEQSIENTPEWAEGFILDAVPDPSWRLLANRLPSMMRFAAAQTRYGIADQSAVCNVYLPDRAASQIGLASLFAMHTTETMQGSVAESPAKAVSLEELLSQKMSVSFDQESLEFGVNIIVDQFVESLPASVEMPPVRIVGSDLQKMGITQNQQIRDFSKIDLSFRRVLTDLLLGANPDKTATGSHDPKQSLIWVVVDDAENIGNKEILITTRQAAAGKYELPAEFVTP